MKTNWNESKLGDLEDYSNAGGCLLILNKDKRRECQDAQNQSAEASAQAELLTAQAILEKSKQKEEEGLSPMAITGIIVGSLMAITVMVVVIKKVKAKKG